MSKVCVLKRPLLLFSGFNSARAVSNKSSYWKNGEVLDIYVYTSARPYLNDIKRAYADWLEGTSLTANFNIEKEKSDIRIDFRPGRGSWSYVGTDALFIRKSDPTMSLGWEGMDVIYHEVGHSLGFLHEHQNPSGGIKWNRDKVIQELSKPPNSWNLSEINSNVLNAINPSMVNYTSFDPDSVMLYFFPSSWTLDGKGTKENPAPSKTDLSHIKTLYPKSADNTDIKGFLQEMPHLPHWHKEHLVYALNYLKEHANMEMRKNELIKLLNKSINA